MQRNKKRVDLIQTLSLTNQMIQLPIKMQSPFQNKLITMKTKYHKIRSNRTINCDNINNLRQIHKYIVGLSIDLSKSPTAHQTQLRSSKTSCRLNRLKMVKLNDQRKKKLSNLIVKQESLYDKSIKKKNNISFKNQLKKQLIEIVNKKKIGINAVFQNSLTDAELKKRKRIEKTTSIIIQLKQLVKNRGRHTFYRQLSQGRNHKEGDDKLATTTSFSHDRSINETALTNCCQINSKSIFKLRTTSQHTDVVKKCQNITKTSSPVNQKGKSFGNDFFPWNENKHRFNTEANDREFEDMEEWLDLHFCSILK